MNTIRLGANNRRKRHVWNFSVMGVAALLASSAATAQTESHAGAIPLISTTESSPSDTSQRQGIFSDLGNSMSNWGFSPSFDLTQMYLGNPSVGQQTGKHEALTLISLGGSFDLQKIAGINGATINFLQLYVPFTHNLGWGSQAGDILAGQPGPYVPKVSHLMMLTWDQKLLDDKLEFGIGKSNAGFYFATPVCNQEFGCQSAILQNSAGMSPPIYANWGARVRYKFTSALSVQTGLWRSSPTYPFTNGWDDSSIAPQSNMWLANIAYETTYQTDAYPKRYELMFYYNTAVQTDPYTQTTHKGTSGMYAGARQVIYRPDQHTSATNPTALAAFGNLTATFDQKSTTGLAMTAITGLTLEAPFRGRPYDSYSVSASMAAVTDDEQKYLKAQNLIAGGSGYTVGRTQLGLRLDANIAASRSVTLSPYVLRTWRTNTWGNPTVAQTPRNGYAFGVLAKISLGKLLGLSDR